MLTVATPKDSKLRALAEQGIVVPGEIPKDEDSVPLDFTTLSNRDIGSLQSRYAVRYAHAIYHVAGISSNIVRLRRDLRLAESRFRVLHQGEKKTDVDAEMEEDDEIARLRNRFAKAEAEHEILDAVARGYDALRGAASREIARRSGERAAID